MRTLVALFAVCGLVAGAAADEYFTYDVDVAGIESWDSQGSPNNTILNLDLGSGDMELIGVAWNVSLTTEFIADNPSWVSEMQAYLGGPDGLSLSPGAEMSEPGTGSFDSGGIVFFADVGFSNIPITNGQYALEFCEGYDDQVDAQDGLWQSGTLTLAVTPEPASMALLALGALAMIRRR